MCEKDVKKPAQEQAFSHQKQTGARPPSRSKVLPAFLETMASLASR
jgi:hypothetical protein